MVDTRQRKQPKDFVVPNTTTEHKITCISSLFSRYWYPTSLVSDNGPELTSEEIIKQSSMYIFSKMHLKGLSTELGT